MTLMADRAFETTTGEGTGTISLLGAVSGFVAFRDAFASNDKVFYLIEQNDGVDGWEAGIGTLTEGSPDTISRDQVLASSNAGGGVNFGPGTKSVLCVPAAEVFAGAAAGFSGTSRPVWLRAGGMWVDTSATPWIVKIYDGTDDIELWEIDITGNLAKPYFDDAPLTRLPRGYIDGFELTNNGTDSQHDIDIASGAARSDDDSADIELPAGITKRFDATFVEGTDQGGLDTGTLAASESYDLYGIRKDDGTADIVGTVAGTSLLVPSGFTRQSKIGGFSTGVSNDIINDQFTRFGQGINGSEFVSAEQAITAGTLYSIPHGLAGTPRSAQVRIRCKTAEFGYSVGEEVIIDPNSSTAGTTRSSSLIPKATTVDFKLSSTAAGIIVANKTTGLASPITFANWRLLFEAWR